MERTPRLSASQETIASGAHAAAAFMGWMEKRGLTWQDLERTVLNVCRLAPRGATPSEIARYVLDVHALLWEDEPTVLEFVRALWAQGKIQRAPGYRFISLVQEVPARIMVVRVPEGEEGLFRPYVYQGTAAWEAGS